MLFFFVCDTCREQGEIVVHGRNGIGPKITGLDSKVVMRTSGFYFPNLLLLVDPDQSLTMWAATSQGCSGSMGASLLPSVQNRAPNVFPERRVGWAMSFPQVEHLRTIVGPGNMSNLPF